MDTPLSEVIRTEHIYSDSHLLGALKRYRGLRTYPTASRRDQRALHEAMERLAAAGKAVQVGRDGAAVNWSAV